MVESNGTAIQWPEVRGIISDLDGVVYRGDAAVPGAPEAFAHFARLGIPYCFVTNNSTRSAEDVASKLRQFGVPATPEQVVTSGFVAGEVMRERWPSGTAVYVLGAPALHDAISAAGFRVTDDNPEVVVMGLDRDISHGKLCRAVEAILGGATLIGTNPDLLLPTATGFEPGAGAMLTAVSVAARVKPIVIGKPEPLLIETALGRMGTARSATLMVGDQLATDIQAGKRAGLWSVLVTTGVPGIEAADLMPPDATIAGLAEIPV